ncbi:MAG: segregation/condensation protein A [Schwartzia sp.]|nr:segregation/condensation protein A [Schwartzia sp. (in: firmicutes)]
MSETESYKVHLEAFEGPMDLLMHLIEKNRIDIYDIPVAALTEQYLAYLESMKRFNIEVASEFLVMAATLLYIKSRMMLPKPPKEEAVAVEEDPRRELIERLLEYQRYKKASVTLADMAAAQGRCVARAPMEIPVRRLPPENLSVEALWKAFLTSQAVRRELAIPQAIVAHEEFRVEEQMERIMARLTSQQGPLPFEELFAAGSREELVADFLALLELIRRKYITVRQDTLFSGILIWLRDAGAASRNEEEADVPG